MCLITVWSCIALCLFPLPAALKAQAPTTERPYTLEAVSTENPDGTLSISANGPRPLWEALNLLYSKYGIEVDYEEPHYSDDQLYGPRGMGRRLKEGRLQATIPFKKPASTAHNNLTMIESLVKQYNDFGAVKFEVYSHKSGHRIDVIPAKAFLPSLLNTPVVINGENLSLEDVIDSTLRQVAKNSGNCVERGGVADNSLIVQKAQFKTIQSIPAREVLAQALDETGMKKLWLLTYDPQSSCFAFGVFNVHGQIPGE